MAVGEQSTALVDEETANPAEQAEANDTRKRLERAVAMLPDRERLIVSMHYFEGVRFKEIGSLLGVSEPRISQLHARAMEKLRACLQEEEASARAALRVVKSLPRSRLSGRPPGPAVTGCASRGVPLDPLPLAAFGPGALRPSGPGALHPSGPGALRPSDPGALRPSGAAASARRAWSVAPPPSGT
jgi:hypothetical protein